jgi:hypothetical protein
LNFHFFGCYIEFGWGKKSVMVQAAAPDNPEITIAIRFRRPLAKHDSASAAFGTVNQDYRSDLRLLHCGNSDVVRQGHQNTSSSTAGCDTRAFFALCMICHRCCAANDTAIANLCSMSCRQAT